MASLHTIKAYLYDNALTDNPNDFVARVSTERSLNVRDICESAQARGGADVSAAAMEHAVNLFLKEMGYRLCDGFGVNTGWFVAAPHIKGVFTSPADRFDPSRHRVLFELQQGAELRKELEQVHVDVLGVADAGLFISQVTDVKTGSVNEFITPGRNLKINGHKIKIAGNHTANGVYFVAETGDTRLKVDPTDIVTNNPSELMVVIPELLQPQTGYRVEITTQYSERLLKEPRTFAFNRILTVL
ncbi:MAG: DUF4469 domain-containing protein [Bacteroidales bacterium]|jgi:hypothetical protein|nr:DUF4469 domain-containing protein [Bacteroidales bacterium]